MIRTEDQVIIGHTDRAINSSGLSLDKFASDLLVPELEKIGIIKYNAVESAGEYMLWRNKNCVQFHRVMRGTTKFPLSWKWPWVNSLPEPYRTECRRELLAIAGVLDIPIPSCSVTKAGGSKSRLAHIMREFSEVIAVAGVAQDGSLDECDSNEDLNRYYSELVDVYEEVKREILAVSIVVNAPKRSRGSE